MWQLSVAKECIFKRKWRSQKLNDLRASRQRRWKHWISFPPRYCRVCNSWATWLNWWAKRTPEGLIWQLVLGSDSCDLSNRDSGWSLALQSSHQLPPMTEPPGLASTGGECVVTRSCVNGQRRSREFCRSAGVWESRYVGLEVLHLFREKIHRCTIRWRESFSQFECSWQLVLVQYDSGKPCLLSVMVGTMCENGVKGDVKKQ